MEVKATVKKGKVRKFKSDVFHQQGLGKVKVHTSVPIQLQDDSEEHSSDNDCESDIEDKKEKGVVLKDIFKAPESAPKPPLKKEEETTEE